MTALDPHTAFALRANAVALKALRGGLAAEEALQLAVLWREWLPGDTALALAVMRFLARVHLAPELAVPEFQRFLSDWIGPVEAGHMARVEAALEGFGAMEGPHG